MLKQYHASLRSELVRIARNRNRRDGKLLKTSITLCRRSMKGLMASLMVILVGVDARAQALGPTIAEAVQGCWTKRSDTLGDYDYWSLCIAQDGTVTSTVISGSFDGGLSGTSSGGVYEVVGDQIRFVFEAGDYGWLWASGDVICTPRFIGSERLDLTKCDDGGATVHFKRFIAEVE